MRKNQKEALIGLISGIGVIVLLLGLFTGLYGFLYGLVAAIAIWILAGVVAKYYGVEKKRR